jgi:hypothetical protein
MTPEQIEDQIQALLAEAEPLRVLDADDPEQAPLTGLVDQINSLRALQAKATQEDALRALSDEERDE